MEQSRKAQNPSGLKKLVIIPAFNEEQGIELAVRGVLEQAPDYDYLVVNDCSKPCGGSSD